MKKTLALLLSLALVSMNFYAVVTIAEDSPEMLVQTSEEDSVLTSGLHMVIGTNTYGYKYILDNGCCITDLEIEEYAETPFELEYGDIVEIDCDTATGTVPKYYEFELGVRIRFQNKAEEYYKDNLKELVATEVQEDTIILAEKNPENPENPVVYELDKMPKSLRDYYSSMLGDFNVDEMEVNDYGVFAVDPATQKAICAVEVHYGNAIDTSQTAEFELIEMESDSIFVKSVETGEYHLLELNNKTNSVMSKETFWSLSSGDILLFTVDAEGNPEIPIEVAYALTVEDFIQRGKMHTVIGVSEDGTDFFLDNHCSLSTFEIERYAETPFTPEYGDLVCVDCNMILETFPGQFALNPGIRIYPVGKAGDYYKDDLKELVVTEVEECKIFLTEKNPENPEKPVVYWLNKVHHCTDGYYSADLNGFDVDTLAVGDSGVFAVEKRQVICAVEIHVEENPVQSAMEKGDVDGDGEISIVDVVLMNRVYVGVEKIGEEQRKAGDIDKNGKIDLSDSMFVLCYLVGLEDSLELDT